MQETSGVTRRGALAAGAALTALAGAPGATSAATRKRRPRVADIGTGGSPMSLPDLQKLGREVGEGQAVCLVDLAALDANLKVVLATARERGMVVRPALKTMPCAQLSAYVLQKLPEPRAMVFSLQHARATIPRAPRGTDFMMGYPPTPRELAWHLGKPLPKRPHRLRVLVDSVPLLEEFASLARRTRHPLPLEVALEVDVGMGRGGMDSADETKAALKIFRDARDRLRLTALLGYDGHATLTGTGAWRDLVAATAQQRYREHLDVLNADGAGLFDAQTLVKNGPASSNYVKWTDRVANECSPGSAFLFAGYLGDFDHDNLTPAVTLAAPVFKITSDSPSLPYTQTTLPGSTREEILIRTLWWSDCAPAVAFPGGLESDELSGGGWAMTAPKGALELGDPVIFRPGQTGEAMVPFGAVHAVREGTVRRVWPVLPRPQTV
jgi:D-serine deaminase-like pyridoxal phosphate-dependent protein